MELAGREDERSRRLAFHEAGHAWMMWKAGLGVRSAALEPGTPVAGDNRGLTVPDRVMEEGRRDLAEKFARSCLAGCVAEYHLLGGWDEEGLQSRAYDRGRARCFLSMSGQDWHREALEFTVLSLENSVADEISVPRVWHSVTLLAYALMERKTMTGEEVAAVMENV